MGSNGCNCSREQLIARLGRAVGIAFVEKRRQNEVLSGGTLVGDVTGQTVLILDDLCATGGNAGPRSQGVPSRGRRGCTRRRHTHAGPGGNRLCRSARQRLRARRHRQHGPQHPVSRRTTERPGQANCPAHSPAARRSHTPHVGTQTTIAAAGTLARIARRITTASGARALRNSTQSSIAPTPR